MPFFSLILQSPPGWKKELMAAPPKGAVCRKIVRKVEAADLVKALDDRKVQVRYWAAVELSARHGAQVDKLLEQFSADHEATGVQPEFFQAVMRSDSPKVYEFIKKSCLAEKGPSLPIQLFEAAISVGGPKALKEAIKPGDAKKRIEITRFLLKDYEARHGNGQKIKKSPWEKPKGS